MPLAKLGLTNYLKQNLMKERQEAKNQLTRNLDSSEFIQVMPYKEVK